MDSFIFALLFQDTNVKQTAWIYNEPRTDFHDLGCI